jgi:hypothetical protein
MPAFLVIAGFGAAPFDGPRCCPPLGYHILGSNTAESASRYHDEVDPSLPKLGCLAKSLSDQALSAVSHDRVADAASGRDTQPRVDFVR